MAEADDIPSGLYPIRTRCAPPEEPSSSGGGDEKLAGGAARRDAGCEKGSQKGRKIARWLTSHITRKNSNKASDDISLSAKVNKSVDRRDLVGHERFLIDHNDLSQKISLLESGFHNRTTKGKKSFSHELGTKGGIRPSLLRAHSYSDLKELLGSLHSKFDAAKEAVNGELAAFVEDVRLALESESFSNTQGKAEDLLILSQQCIEMTSGQFRENCESIVQNLSERRHQCEAGLLRQLVTRMLFILTRCTRILQFQKDSGPINEDSFESFKQCLESVPAVEMNWVPKPNNVDFSLNNTVKQYFHKHQSKEENKNTIPSTESCSTLTDVRNVSSSSYRKVLPSCHQNAYSQGHQAGGHSSKKLMEESPWDLFDEQDRYSEDVDSVVCRICEKSVPASHLESHSYICAYADKCNLEGTNLDDCLLNIAEVLEQIMEIYNQSVETSYSSPEISRIRSTQSAVGPAVHSPKLQEWHNKGLEGMFEDIHEMETASIDDFYYGSSSYMKGYLDMKLGHCGPGSSNGIMTPISSTNSPRLSHFDLFWLEHNNQSEREDIHQIIEMADIARRAMNIDVASEGAYEILAMCMQDLVNILLHNPLKALVIDTFGSRIKDLLKEKYLLAIGLLNKESFINTFELEDCRGHPLHNGSDYTVLASLQSSHKERTSIDDFEIIKPISRGAFGRVFLARKRTTGDLFAIKVLKKLDMIRKNDIERILAERNILITVRNPFVVRFFYSFTCRDNLYLVMEYLNGGDLYSLLRKVDCLTEDVARVYIAELVLALEYLHSLGIIHRDLKPDNILIARDGHIKLTDFGLSKIGLINNSVDLSTSGKNGSIPSDVQTMHAFSEHDQQGKRTRRSAVGTPDYLAPEILLGTEHGYAADWWSVAIILFEFLTGIPPFTERLPEIIFDNILNRKIPWPNVPDEMSYEARDLIDRLLVQDPSLRLGAKGASEVKAHPFFKEINWDNLALQKVAFIPNPDSVDDTSYFLSRYSLGSYQIPVDKSSSDCASTTIDSCSDTSCESKMDKHSEPMEFNSNASLDLSSISFSFKNLSQLASMNYDVLLQSGRTSKCSSPARGPGP